MPLNDWALIDSNRAVLVLQLVGLGVTGWFVYRYLGTGEDRYVTVPLACCFILSAVMCTPYLQSAV
jgi:hypothetical protein